MEQSRTVFHATMNGQCQEETWIPLLCWHEILIVSKRYPIGVDRAALMFVIRPKLDQGSFRGLLLANGSICHHAVGFLSEFQYFNASPYDFVVVKHGWGRFSPKYGKVHDN